MLLEIAASRCPPASTVPPPAGLLYLLCPACPGVFALFIGRWPLPMSYGADVELGKLLRASQQRLVAGLCGWGPGDGSTRGQMTRKLFATTGQKDGSWGIPTSAHSLWSSLQRFHMCGHELHLGLRR